MALPPTPPGYLNWNEYITLNAPFLMAIQGLTFQQAKASIKLLDVAMPVRQEIGTPSYRIYNTFTTWAARTVAPTQGRPWILTAIPESQITTQDGSALVTQDNLFLVTT